MKNYPEKLMRNTNNELLTVGNDGNRMSIVYLTKSQHYKLNDLYRYK